jgi:alkylhydroperoxidase family enzyme
MSWITGHQPADFNSLFSLRPNLFQDYQAFAELFWQRGLVPPIALELCRLRVAQLHRCAPELARRRPEARASGLGEDKIAALPDWPGDPRFSAAERACLALAESFTIDPHGISDDMMAEVVAALGEAGAVALLECLALFDGFCRFQVLLQAKED